MAKLYDSSNNLLTRSVRVIPRKKPIKIENTLLNGQLDTQIIGTPEDIMEIEFACTYANLLVIDDASATGESVKLNHESVEYTCYIKGDPSFNLDMIGPASKRYYQGKMTLSVIT